MASKYAGAGSIRWIIQFFSSSGKEDVAPDGAFAVQHDHDLVGPPLLGLVGAVVPDRDVAGAVLALGDLALERAVVEGMVFDVHGEVIGVGVHRKTLRQRPRDEDSVAFEAKVPVQRPGVVLLDDEGREVRLLLALRGSPPSAQGSSSGRASPGRR